MAENSHRRFIVRGDYINGKFQVPRNANGEWLARSPADMTDQLGKFTYSYQAVEESIMAARQAYPQWRKGTLADRMTIVHKYRDAISRRGDELAEILACEIGKPLWEARTEVAATLAGIDAVIDEGAKLISDFEAPVSDPGTHAICRHRPLGVMAVIGQFSLPSQFVNSHLVPALLAGNTMILKPSEKAPFVGQFVAECFHDAGMPAGVFNLLQGEREASRRLCAHEGLDGILFTGSNEVGTRIKQDTLQQHWKLVSLHMGGKNSTIVWEDADFDHALQECLAAGYIFAGQLCTSSSRIIVHKKIFDRFLDKFHERAKGFSIGHPMENPFMGPLIESSAVDRYMKFMGIASREGCEVVMRGKVLELPIQGNYVAPSVCCVKKTDVAQVRKSVYLQTELLGPNVALMAAEDLDHAIALANSTQYGLVTSVLTASRSVYDRCREELNCGLINWNRSTLRSSPYLPFGGLKKSGNHFPGGVLAPLYCTAPISSLEVEPSALKTEDYPGLK